MKVWVTWVSLLLLFAALLSCGSGLPFDTGYIPIPVEQYWVAVTPYMAPGENYDEPPYRVVFLVNWETQLGWQPNEHGVRVPERMVIDPDGEGPIQEEEVDLTIPGTSLPSELLDRHVGYPHANTALTFLEVTYEEPGNYVPSFQVYDAEGLHAGGEVLSFALPRELRKSVGIQVRNAPGYANIGSPPYRMLVTVSWTTAPYWQRNLQGILVPEQVKVLSAPALLPQPEPVVTTVDLDSLTKHGVAEVTVELTYSGRNIVNAEVIDSEGVYGTAFRNVYLPNIPSWTLTSLDGLMLPRP